MSIFGGDIAIEDRNHIMKLMREDGRKPVPVKHQWSGDHNIQTPVNNQWPGDQSTPTPANMSSKPGGIRNGNLS